jgi:hypothetical protein
MVSFPETSERNKGRGVGTRYQLVFYVSFDKYPNRTDVPYFFPQNIKKAPAIENHRFWLNFLNEPSGRQ